MLTKLTYKTMSIGAVMEFLPVAKRWRFYTSILILVVMSACVILVVHLSGIVPFLRAYSIYTRKLDRSIESSSGNSSLQSLPDQAGQSSIATGPLYVHPENGRYFTDGSGKAILLVGSHTWCDFMDCGEKDPPPVFDYIAFLDFLQANNHNFFRLWRAENAKGGERGINFWFNPMPYQRPGPEIALDGKPKFDLDRFNQAYFNRMRERIIEARNRGIYVSIMLFDGWSVESKIPSHNPWLGHPFNRSNNINKVDGDPNGNGNGEETHTLQIPGITAYQEAYVKKVIDTVNDLDNVLYEISNESNTNSQDWQYHMIDYVKAYEATKPKRHPVGMTVEYPGGNNAELFASPADWISPKGDVNNPPAADGTKVILNDTDHLCGICGDRSWVWKSFTRGVNPVFMDPYDGQAPGRGAPPGYDPTNAKDVSIRKNLGYVRLYSERMNLVTMKPRGDLCSTGYCLANPVASGAEFLVYLPSGSTTTTILESLGMRSQDHQKISSVYLLPDSSVTVDLSATSGSLMVEWFDPSTGKITPGGTVTGGARRAFTAPFTGDAVLYLYQLAISNLVVHPWDNFASISWNTNKPATSQVEYGTSPGLGMSTPETVAYVTSHSVHVPGLSPNTKFYFKVRSKDTSGQSVESQVSSFTTLAPGDIRRNYLTIILNRLNLLFLAAP